MPKKQPTAKAPKKASKSLNRNLGAARATKQDEFYTQLADIERQLRHYTAHFANKTVLCNCDDPTISNFFHYFSHNFEKLKLKTLITTCYRNCDVDLFTKNAGERGAYLVYEGDKKGNRVPDPAEIGIHHFEGDGDFRSQECIRLLEEADIVVTNPPFSLFREYVAQLVEHDKNFIIVGGKNAITYKDVFGLIRDNKIWLGYEFTAGNAFFAIPPRNARAFSSGVYDASTGLVKFRNVGWYTNLDIAKRHEELIMYKEYSPDEYPKYDNFDAIEVSKVADIPADYHGVMGVPGGFLEKYNPDQFEIVGITKTWCGLASKKYPTQIQVDPDGSESEVSKLNDGAAIKSRTRPAGRTYYRVGGEYFTQTYPRILIRRKSAQ